MAVSEAMNELLILGAAEIEAALTGHELEIVETVRRAYEAHAAGMSSLPHSLFLRFPDNDSDRIIALPGYLGDGFEIAGLKWIASMPGNVAKGIERASAVVIVNDRATGRPRAILEGSIISARRTAASAALAGKTLHGETAPETIGVVGCGPIAFEIVRSLRAVWSDAAKFLVFDLNAARAAEFCARCEALHAGARFAVAGSLADLLAASPVTAFATTAGTPHLSDLSICPPGATILHISLRDLTADVILAADNVVDDADHVSRASTSIHLAEQKTGNRDFIRCALADITAGRQPARVDRTRPVIFSPFGLGVLDLALAQMVLNDAARSGGGVRISGFLPS
ncbi:MAG TPA: 2,3-diaminopropionate biosynthesis protein SbnB [Thermoanaerobaculia bacterium]|nr:2,3-diaminopropionate biosynthesis protein SbnB [Thermoanaerobaculia bacterium]